MPPRCWTRIPTASLRPPSPRFTSCTSFSRSWNICHPHVKRSTFAPPPPPPSSDLFLHSFHVIFSQDFQIDPRKARDHEEATVNNFPKLSYSQGCQACLNSLWWGYAPSMIVSYTYFIWCRGFQFSRRFNGTKSVFKPTHTASQFYLDSLHYAEVLYLTYLYFLYLQETLGWY